VGTTHPGNIGAVARAMKNMCLSELYLVAPARYPHADATARASGADDLLAEARVCPDLDSAVHGCRLVIGASARRRSVDWPTLEPRACAERLWAESRIAPVALVFGREKSGLSNAELDRCGHLVQIPANPDYASLNLGAAAQILGYEIYLASRLSAEGDFLTSPADVASADAMEAFFRHLEQALFDIGFLQPVRGERLMRRLRRLFNRARPEAEELNILRGILSAAQGRKSMRR